MPVSPPANSPPERPVGTGSLHAAGRIHDFFASIAARYDLANHLLSAGLDYSWRRRAARLVAAWNPEQVLDLACGSGDLTRELARVLPGKLVLGADFCLPMLERARSKGIRHLVAADALRLPFAEASFDAVTVAFGLRNMDSWTLALQAMARQLRPGGRLLILDFSLPPRPLRWLYRPYLHLVLPLIASWVTGEAAAYRYLAESIEAFPSGEAMNRLLKESGFTPEAPLPLHGGIVTIHQASKAG